MKPLTAAAAAIFALVSSVPGVFAQGILLDSDLDGVPDIIEMVNAPNMEVGRIDAPIPGATVYAAGRNQSVYLLFGFTDFGAITRLRVSVAISPNRTAVDVTSIVLQSGRIHTIPNSQRPAVYISFEIPRAALGSMTWNVFSAWWEGGATPRATGHLSFFEGRAGLVGLVGIVQQNGEERSRAKDLEARDRPPFPPDWMCRSTIPQYENRECEQGLHRISGPVYMVVREECVFEPSRNCVADCGEMNGRVVINLDEAWGLG